jgi:flagellar biosynthesis protein FlhF
VKVRIFSALTIQEAMNQVKETLGRDAIILHTRKFRKGGIGGFFGREIVEVMAAVDSEPTPTILPSPKKTVRAKVPVRSLIRPSVKPPFPAKETVSPSKTVAAPSEDAEKPESISSTLLQADNFVAVSPDLAGKKADKQLVLDPLPAAVITQERRAESAVGTPTDAAVQTIDNTYGEELKNEITGMRFVLEQLLAKTKTISANPWYDYLVEKGITSSLAEQVLKDFPCSLVMADKNRESAKKMLYNRFVCYIRYTEGIKLPKVGCKKIALVGPTGVGKTTTLAKLAARFTLEENAAVAFITADTYRIAAVEQLKTYANILNIPLDVVYSSEELKSSLQKHEDKNIILIDSAGRSQHNEEQIIELKELLDADDAIEPHLVLSTNTTYKDMVDIINRFADCFSASVIFTKLDEARSVGNIFNIMYSFSELSISYIANGQSVPDDIHHADADYLTNSLLRD